MQPKAPLTDGGTRQSRVYTTPTAKLCYFRCQNKPASLIYLSMQHINYAEQKFICLYDDDNQLVTLREEATRDESEPPQTQRRWRWLSHTLVLLLFDRSSTHENNELIAYLSSQYLLWPSNRRRASCATSGGFRLKIKKLTLFLLSS